MTEFLGRIARRTFLFVAVPLVAAAPIVPAAAQQADSLPFRKGQWGAEFFAGDFSGIGALRFTKQNTAWLVDVQGRFIRESGNDDNPSITPGIVNYEIDSDALQLRLGWRRYAPVAPRVVRHVGLGVLASRLSSEQRPVGFAISPPVAFDVSRQSYSAGVFGEIGAQWMITPNLGLGATWSASLTAGTTSTESFSAATFEGASRRKSTSNNIAGSLGGLGIRGAVFF